MPRVVICERRQIRLVSSCAMTFPSAPFLYKLKMAEKQFLNVQYGQIPVRINVTYMVDLSEVQKEVLVAFEEITVGYSKIQLWVTTVENGETKITTWTNLMDLPSTYFAEGGSAVVIKLLAQGLIY